MPTPTNSVLNRDVDKEARVSQLIFDNESLKIEVKTLKEQLESTGALKIEDLRRENEQLKIDNTQLKVQLEEKTSQLSILQNSDERFSNIDGTLAKLLEQLQAQRDELTELRLVGKEKDDKIIEYKVHLERVGKELVEAREKNETQVKELQQELESIKTEKETLTTKLQGVETATAVSTSDMQELEAKLSEKEERIMQCENELLAIKEYAAAQSAIRGGRATEQEKTIADLQQREAASQGKIVNLERELGQARETLQRAKDAYIGMRDSYEQKLASAAEELRNEREKAAAAASQATTRAAQTDLYSPEVKALVETKVKEAVADRERRLQEQVNENTALLSRIALIQHESEQMVKKAGLTGRDVNAMKERVDAVSKARGARSNMERRVADFLSSETFSKQDVEMLLQEMLDYQERTEEDISTRLLIKDMQAEEAEKTFRWNLKRLENENASLLKQLQKAAFASMQRHARGEGTTTHGGPDNAANHPINDQTSPRTHTTTGPAGTTTTTSMGGITTATSTTPNQAPPAPHRGSSPMAAAPAQGTRGPFTLSEETTPMRSAMPQLYQQQSSPQGTYPMNSLPPQPPQRQVHFQDPYAMAAGQYAPPQQPNPSQNAAADGGGYAGYAGGLQQIPLRPVESSSPLHAVAGGAGATNADPHRNVIVRCPACTFEQRFGNRKCEICETPLVLPRTL